MEKPTETIYSKLAKQAPERRPAPQIQKRKTPQYSTKTKRLVGPFGNLGMASSLTTGLLFWWNGEQLLKKILAWFASKLRKELLIHLVFGERVTYDVVLLFFLGFASLVTGTVILCSLYIHI